MVTTKSTAEGVTSFSESFDELFEVIEARRVEVMRSIIARHGATLGQYQAGFESTLKDLDKQKVVSRMWKKDPRVWKDDPAHEKIIRNALGWLKVAETMQPHIAELAAFAQVVEPGGITGR